MAFTRALVSKILRDHGITEESDIKSAVQELTDLHISVTDPMKKQLDEYREMEEEKDKIQKELDTLKNDDWKKKFEDEHAAFDKFKADTEAANTQSAKEKAYRELLAKSGIGEKYLAQVLKVSDLGKVELDDNGAIKDSEKLTESIKSEWSGFISSENTGGAKVSTPPGKTNTKMTRDQIMAIKDRTERRAAIAQNPEAFTTT